MNRSIRIGTLYLAVAFGLAVSVSAAAVPIQTKTALHEPPDWQDKIIPSSQLTVLELTRRLIPDIRGDPNKSDRMIANDLSGVRLLDGVEETGMELETESNDEHEITESDYFWIKDEGENYLVLLVMIDGEKVVIGLFKTSSEISLLDAVTIAQDMHVDVDREKLWQVRPGGQAFTVHCWHDNSSESFDAYIFISIVNRKLRAIADPGAFYGFSDYSAARERLCKTATSPRFQFVRSPGRGYYDLVVTVMTLKACHADSQEWSWKTGIVFRKSARRLWRWSPKMKQYRKVSTPRR
jgi:hypothetical protein